MYGITNISMKDISKILENFEKLSYKGYVRKSPKQEPNYSYFYLSKQPAKCAIISDVFNLHVDPVRTEMTVTQQIPISHVCDLEKS